MNVSKTKFEKDLKSIIGKEDYRIDLYKKGMYIGCIHLGYNDFIKSNKLTKESIMAGIAVEKRTNEYDYDKDDGSTLSYLAIWLENVAGYNYYEFDSWYVRCI
jgi:hypothetical protein